MSRYRHGALHAVSHGREVALYAKLVRRHGGKLARQRRMREVQQTSKGVGKR